MTATKVFISIDAFTKDEFETYINDNPTHQIIIWAPENVYVPQLYKTPEEWESFSANLDTRGIDYTVVVGYSGNDFYSSHPRVIGWDDFAAYDILLAFSGGRLSISPSPKDMSKHFVTKFGRETLGRTVMADSLEKYGIMDKTSFHYYNNGNDFIFDQYKPKYWGGTPSELIYDDSNYDIPAIRYYYLSAAMEVIVEKSLIYPHIYNYFFIPILFGKPSVVLAAKGYYQRVKDIFGFDMYEDIIDVFDQDDNRMEVADKISRQLKQLSDAKSADHIVRDLGPRAVENLRKMVDHVKKKNVDERIKDFVELPELSYYKNALFAADKITFMGKSIY